MSAVNKMEIETKAPSAMQIPFVLVAAAMSSLPFHKKYPTLLGDRNRGNDAVSRFWGIIYLINFIMGRTGCQGVETAKHRALKTTQ